MMAIDAKPYRTTIGDDAPAEHAFAITPDDNNDLDNLTGGGVTRGLWVGSAGNVAVVTQSGASVTFKGIAAGTLLPVKVKRVLSTGTNTTADTILGLA
jgi:hypothetical protein